MNTHNKTLYYILAFIIVTIWSSTFISTKILLTAFTPVEILFYRFFLAWILMFVVYPHFHRPESLKKELVLVFLGISGGSLYFIAENIALTFSLASNVAILVSTAPVFTVFLAFFFLKDERITVKIILGALIAFCGVALVILNGSLVLKLNPAGDILALVSAMSWAVYSILIRKLDSRFSSLYYTRKIFFYTLITMIPLLFIFPPQMDFTPLLTPVISFNLILLTVFSSCIAYAVWNRVVWNLGATSANNFIYFIPLLTMIESAILLDEPITPYALTGALCIFAGVYLASIRAHKQT